MKSIFGEKDGDLRNAQSQLANNQFKKAEDILLKYMEVSPDYFGQLYLALAIHQQNRTSEALGILQDIIKQNPPEPEVFLYYRALLFFDNMQFDKCLIELEKIKNANFFHEALKLLAVLFKDFARNSKDAITTHKTLSKCYMVSSDLQARVLFKLESYMPINLAKRAYATTYSFTWKPIILGEHRTLNKNKKLQNSLEHAILKAEANEFNMALEIIENCFQMGLNNLEVEKTRLRIAELILAKLEIATTLLDPSEIAWAYFFTQQFQKGVDYCHPFIQNQESSNKNSNYLYFLDIAGYLYFCLGNFTKAENLLSLKVKLDSKDSEHASYYYAACLQHSKKPFEALNAYKVFINNNLNGYENQINFMMKTLAPDLKIN